MARRRLISYPLSLAFVVATLVLLTGAWIAVWNYRAGMANTRELAGSLFDQVARDTADQTSAFVMRAAPAAQTVTGLARLDDGQLAPEARLRRFLAILAANPQFTWVSYSDASGEFTGVYHPPAGGVRTNHSRIADGKTVLDEYDVDAAGAWTLFRHEPDTGYDPRKRPFYGLAAAAKAGAWTEPYVFVGKTPVPGITYAEPLVVDGELRGVVTIDFDLGRLTDLVRALAVSEHGRVAIVSADGIVLAHPTAPVVAANGTDLVHADALADPAARAILAAGDGITEGVLVDGTPYLARSLKVPGGLPWRVLVFAPESDFTASVRGRIASSLLISLAAVVVAVLVAWLLAHRVSDPLTALAGEMAQVGEFRIDDRGRPATMFREIEMMNAALVRMKGGLRSFARYVPRDLVRAVLASGHEASLSGEVKELTVFFSDLAGFTTLAESMAPDALVRLLGDYFDGASKIIAHEGGTVDKYLGDGIMAFWGAPLPQPEHAIRSCAAALACQRQVRELAAKGTQLTVRIGLATGDVLVGNIGSPERMNYTVMGDTANLAARLESLNKQYGTGVMIGEGTFQQAGTRIVARPLDVVAVKGKQRGVRVYELLAMTGDGDADAEAIAADSTVALDAYLAKDFMAAVAAWQKVLDRRPGDRAATLMRDRALGYVETPPDRGSWTGVTVATEK
jgi:adenylate cyclase